MLLGWGSIPNAVSPRLPLPTTDAQCTSLIQPKYLPRTPCAQLYRPRRSDGDARMSRFDETESPQPWHCRMCAFCGDTVRYPRARTPMVGRLLHSFKALGRDRRGLLAKLAENGLCCNDVNKCYEYSVNREEIICTPSKWTPTFRLFMLVCTPRRGLSRRDLATDESNLFPRRPLSRLMNRGIVCNIRIIPSYGYLLPPQAWQLPQTLSCAWKDHPSSTPQSSPIHNR